MSAAKFVAFCFAYEMKILNNYAIKFSNFRGKNAPLNIAIQRSQPARQLLLFVDLNHGVFLVHLIDEEIGMLQTLTSSKDAVDKVVRSAFSIADQEFLEAGKYRLSDCA